MLEHKDALVATNEEAFARGAGAIEERIDEDDAPACARMQADGVPRASVDARCDECAEGRSHHLIRGH